MKWSADCGKYSFTSFSELCLLRKLLEKDNALKLYYLYRRDHPENLKKVGRVSGVRIIPVIPEKDLQYLVVRETTGGYSPLLVFKDSSIAHLTGCSYF
ncbi:MAG: hypothetical protein QXT26_02300 [Thermoproteota archaeon]